MKEHLVFLGLGSNLGDREHNLYRAAELLSAKVKLLKISSVYETEPVGCTAQPLFLNAVLKASTSLTPHHLLKAVKSIEIEMGRESTFLNGPRLIDIDILFYDDRVVENPKLVVPHPRLAGRAFVLVPLAQIAPDFVHPQHHQKIGDLLNRLGTVKGIRERPEIKIG